MRGDGRRGADGQELPIAIIGAGFSGVGMAIRLQRAGIHSFTLFEAADAVGGTWRDNTYPGCACDVPSHLYSFSFERKPDWSRKFGPQPEILEYLERVVDRHGLRRHIRFGTRVVEVRLDEEAGLWRVRTDAGDTFDARVVVSGTGPLSVPAYPSIEGLERFRGKMFHSARWDHDYDLSGKTVAVVGTGASAIQFVPQIAPRVKRLHLFQRTAPWVLPKPDRDFFGWEKSLFRRIPGLTWAYRALIYWAWEARAVGFVVKPKLLELISRLARRHIEQSIRDPELRRTVTPDYTMGCKRILMANDYYPALERDNVEVVPSGVRRITETGLVAEDGTTVDVDAIIFGTGFDPSEILSNVTVIGRDGRDLHQVWHQGAEAYFGISVSGFPNLYLLFGPNTGLGHNSMIFMIEAQIAFVMDAIRTIRREGLKLLDVLPERQREFNARLQDRMKDTVWSTGCKSWYLDDRGHNYTLWPSFTAEYWLRTRRIHRRDFEGVPAEQEVACRH